ncbi:hypothetical protein [Pseudomonas brassicacearum]|nr:hypothetical protein [Pseudomonas brassicacearum]
MLFSMCVGFTESTPPALADSLDRLFDLVEEIGLRVGSPAMKN